MWRRRETRHGILDKASCRLALLLALLTLLLGAFASPPAWATGDQEASKETKQTTDAKEPREPKEKLVSASLVVATNDPDPPVIASALKAREKSLKRIFGYNRFDLIGSGSAGVPGKEEIWLVPSSELFLKVDAKDTDKDSKNGIQADLELWQRGKQILRTRALLRPGSPLFIRGPEWGQGQLIVIISLAPSAA